MQEKDPGAYAILTDPQYSKESDQETKQRFKKESVKGKQALTSPGGRCIFHSHSSDFA